MMAALLEASGLSKTFGAVEAVKGLDFAIEEGRCAALLGPNGAGKTTAIRMLTGLLKPTSGTIRMAGKETTGREAGELLGYLPQSPAFYNWMSGMEYVTYAGKLCGLSAERSKRRAKELLERVGLTHAAKRRIGGYSGGMKQRLGLAQALVHEPRLLIMDEPVSALDPVGRREVLELLRELKRETTVLFSTHVLHDAEELCDDIIIIRSGKVALQGSLADIRNNNRRPVIELRLEEGSSANEWAADVLERVSEHAGAPERASTELLRHIQDARLQGSLLMLHVTDLAQARQALLEELAGKRIGIHRLEAGYSTLEDLFMKAVSE